MRGHRSNLPTGITHASGPRFAANHPLITFYLLAFTISWIGYVPLLVHQLTPSHFTSRLWIIGLLFPGIGPAVATLTATRISRRPAEQENSEIVRLGKAFLTPVPARWWIMTLLLSVGSMASAAVLAMYATGNQDPLLKPLPLSGLLLFSGLSVIANPCEEIGWRGFAQRRLQQKVSVLQAALIVGLLWALWHIPLFLLGIGPMSMAHSSFWPWAAGVFPQAILMAWLYNRTSQSLAIVSAYHFLGNLSGMLFHPSVGMVSLVRLVIALIVVFTTGLPRFRENTQEAIDDRERPRVDVLSRLLKAPVNYDRGNCIYKFFRKKYALRGGGNWLRDG